MDEYILPNLLYPRTGAANPYYAYTMIEGFALDFRSSVGSPQC